MTGKHSPTPSTLMSRIYPELKLIDGSKAFWEISRDFEFRSRGKSYLVGAACGIIPAIGLVGASIGAAFGVISVALAVTIGLTSLVACGLAICVLVRRLTVPILRQCLIDHGIAVCIKCGYDLRGQEEPRCPECGSPVHVNTPQDPGTR